ncbi:hypothetical protein GF413_03275 [Candidatus Micrarchaeota archaeon]|nr:hypothetical protein [Candidatus Micrarchaeota archaeon]
MTASKRIARVFTDFLAEIDSQMQQNRNQKALTQAQMQYQIDQMKIRFETDLAMLRAQSQQEVIQFQEFLDSFEEMKLKIIEAYPNLPRPMALIIHQHAAQKLKSAWHTEDPTKRLEKFNEIGGMMSAIGIDILEAGQTPQASLQPRKTMKLLGIGSVEE